VIVGVGQFLNRVDEGAEALQPTDLALAAASRAEQDADATSSLASRADVVAMVPLISWRYRDPARIVADSIGATGARTWYPGMGGNTPQMLLNRLALQISEGELEIGLLCGAEAWSTRTHVKRSGQVLDWTKQPDDVVADWGSDDTFSMGHPAEHARAIVMPIHTYPLFETAIMHCESVERPGTTPEDHLRRLGGMWADFSRVAAGNPNAWKRTELTADEVITATPANRYVGWPYTKSMVSYPDVDMASALIICSAASAEAAGVPRDRWVFPHSGTDGRDLVMSQRESFAGSPSIGVAGRRALELAGVGIDDVAHLDVYSCFPSAVQLFCREMGIDPLSRQLTVYGGLAFGGGPWNNPVGHALATMVDTLRADPGSIGLVTGNGGNVDKHSFGVLGTEPPASGYRHERPQDEIDAAVGREVLEAYGGPVSIEAWTVMHDRDNEPERMHAACLTPNGQRCWGVTHDADAMSAAMSVDLGGTSATMGDDGELLLEA